MDLVKNPDFLLEIPDGLVKVGFAAESEDLLSNARKKLQAKGLDLIAANRRLIEDSLSKIKDIELTNKKQ